MTSRAIVVTGATGFIGTQLIGVLSASAHTFSLVALTRRPSSLTSLPTWPSHWRAIEHDISSDRSMPSLPAGATIIHLAAATGSASRNEIIRTNITGTLRLIEASKSARGGHMILVSSIAARYDDKRWYAYADSKVTAEKALVQSGIASTIVRPTVVMGPGSAAEAALWKLATSPSPLPLVPGSPHVRMQPIAVRDVARTLEHLIHLAPTTASLSFDLGGPEVLELGELLSRMREARQLTRRNYIPIPLTPIRLVLAAAEKIGLPLPVRAGQLALFANDSSARTPLPPALADLSSTFSTVGEMIGGRRE
ncbi:MAG: NAD-dependent epimerase/dehydratase family protein [Gemmatimonadota bacterium]